MNLFEPGPSTYERDLRALLEQLSPDEVEELQTYFAHKTNDGHALSDHEIAMSDFLHQVRELNRMNDDMALARRIAAGEDIEPGPPSPTRSPHNLNNRPHRLGTGIALPIHVPHILANRPTGHDCVVCQDPIHGTEVPAPCGHHYDIGCITTLFQSATQDETLFPPRCCGENIPFAQAQPHFPRALVMTFQQKQVEYSTLKRVYCFFPKCSRFLGPLVEDASASKVYVCPEPVCKRRTCGKCRQQHLSNLNHICRPDADAAQVLELGRTSGWVRCPGCSHMVELLLGCFHMTCRCRTEFCYRCRALWKTCGCPQAEEQYLMEGVGEGEEEEEEEEEDDDDVEDHHEAADAIHDREGDDDVEEGELEEWQERVFEVMEEREVDDAETYEEQEQEVWHWEREPEVREFDGAEEVQEDLEERVEQLIERWEEEVDGAHEGMQELQGFQEWLQEQEESGDEDADQVAEHEVTGANEEEESWRWEREEPDADDADEEEGRVIWEVREAQVADEEESNTDDADEEEGRVIWEVREAQVADEEEPAEVQVVYLDQEVYDADDADEEPEQWGGQGEQEAESDEADGEQEEPQEWQEEYYDADEVNAEEAQEMWEEQEEPECEEWGGNDYDDSDDDSEW